MTPAAAPATLPAPPPAIEPQGTPAAPRDANAGAPAEEQTAPLSFAQLLAAGLAGEDFSSTPDTDTDTAAAAQPLATDGAAAALAALGLPAALAAAFAPAQLLPGSPAAPDAEAPAARPGQATRAALAMAMPAAPAQPAGSAASTAAANPVGAALEPADAALSLPRYAPDATGFAVELQTHIVEDPGLRERPSPESALLITAFEPAQTPRAFKRVATTELLAPLASADWGRELGDTLRWMSGTQQSVAELRLNPPGLGPLQIVLTLGGDDQRQASVAFISPHGEVRQAIEAALPQLRDMLAGSGIQMGDASVNAQTANADPRPQAQQRDGGRAPQPAPEPRLSITAGSGVVRLRDGAGLIDIFA